MKIKHILSIALISTTSAFAQITVHSEDFQSGLPGVYSIVDNDGLTPHADVSEFADAWIALVDPENPLDTVMGSTSYFDPTGTADRWLITPGILLGTFGNFVHWEAKSHDASYPDNYQILVSTTDTQISSFTDTLDAVTGESHTWTSRSIDLGLAGYNGQTVFIAFVNRTDDGFKLYIDDISIVTEDPNGQNAGVDELNQPTISLYPNPAGETLNVKAFDLENVLIYDLKGQLVLTSTSSQIAINTLKSGAYMVHVQHAGNTTVERLIKL